MKIALHAPGFVKDGFDSPARGEQRWSMNLAHYLGLAGHTIYLIGDMFYYNGKLVRPGWGNCPKVENVEIYTWTDRALLEEKFDIFMDTGWNKDIDDKRNLSIKSDIYISGFWGIDEQIKDPKGLVQSNKNHFYAYPTKRIIEIEDEIRREYDTSKRLFLPIPLYDEWVEKENDNLITWPLKECFYKDRGDSARRSKIILKAIKEITDKDSGAEVFFIGTNEFEYADKESRDILNEIKRKSSSDTQLPYNTCQKIISYTKLLTTNGSPPAGPIYLESVASGGVPICWGNSNHWGEDLIKLGYGLTENNPKEDDIMNFTLKLWNDKNFFSIVRNYMKDKASYYQVNSAIRQFSDEVFKVLERI